MDNRIIAAGIALALSVLAVCLFSDKKWFSIKWLGLTAGLMVLFKFFARLERGYWAHGEEFVAVGLVIVLYSVVHSEPYLAWQEKRRNKLRLKMLSERADLL